jgi:hypothetical protein
MIITIITDDNAVTVDGDLLPVEVAALLGEWAVQFDGDSAEVEYSNGQPNEVIDAATFYARYQSDLDAHAAARLLLNQAVAMAAVPTIEQLLSQLSDVRKSQERQGVTLNGVRYAGDPSNRQALQEAISFMTDNGQVEFLRWKDSDNGFHTSHPLSDVLEAYRAIGTHRVQLIAAEGDYASQIMAGTLTDLTQLTWP